MGIQVDQDWWKTLFDEVYLLTDARSVCDEDLTRREVDVLLELSPIRVKNRILDLCGGHGRHSLEFLARGFSDVVLMDYSHFLVSTAKQAAREKNKPLQCLQGDARNTGLDSESFDHVLILGNSLGYIHEPDADVCIAREALRLLKPGGWFLVDVSDPSNAWGAWNPMAWHEIGGDIVTCRQRERKDRLVNVREMVLSKKEGLLRDQTYSIRYYTPQALEELLQKAGFSETRVHTDFSPHEKEGDFGFMNHRMIAVGRK